MEKPGFEIGNVWNRIISRRVVRRSLAIALAAGPVLIFINQGEAWLGPARIDVGRMILTLIVPYIVATIAQVTLNDHRPDSKTSGSLHENENFVAHLRRSAELSWEVFDVATSVNQASRKWPH